MTPYPRNAATRWVPSFGHEYPAWYPTSSQTRQIRHNRDTMKVASNTPTGPSKHFEGLLLALCVPGSPLLAVRYHEPRPLARREAVAGVALPTERPFFCPVPRGSPAGQTLPRAPATFRIRRPS